MDTELNLPPYKYPYGLRAQIAGAAVQNSFDKAIGNLVNTTGGVISKRQAERLAGNLGQDFEAYHSSRPVTAASAGILVLTVDGKGIVMQQED